MGPGYLMLLHQNQKLLQIETGHANHRGTMTQS